MRQFKNIPLVLVLLLVGSIAYIASCTHKDVVVPSGTANIVRGTAAFTQGQANWKLYNTHSSVLWETGYLGTSGLLTGRFNMFGVSSLAFNESNADAISFEGWVRLTPLTRVNRAEMRDACWAPLEPVQAK